MKITPQLLVRYQQNRCTPAEARAVEQWLRSADDEPSLLTEAQLARMQTEIWDTISPEVLGSKSGKIIPWYQRSLRYAAAACLFIGTFFLGYFASPNAQADTVKKSKLLTDVLHVYGGDGTYGQVDGDRYRIKFEGKLKLYNSANQPKQIVCGEQEFTLDPHQGYYLSRSNTSPYLMNDKQLMGGYDQQAKLVGGFSVLELSE
ncbi:MAG: hypothetical protein AAF944_06905 [Bacteroidota bacterium]